MKLVIKGTGGQGVLFLAKTLAEALLLSGVDNFNFLKEFDEGQRTGEIKVIFELPFGMPDRIIEMTENNIKMLRKVSKELNLDETYIKEALQTIKPVAFEKNWCVYKDED